MPIWLPHTVAVASAEDKKVAIGQPAPEFRIKDSTGKEINLAELTAKGPVLVRLTCGCLGCDKELPYFQELHSAYKAQGLTSLAIFREPDTKVEAYVKEKKLNMLYAVDPKGESWKTFDTKTMPSNFLIAKGGQIVKISAGCDTSGMIAERLSEATAKLTGTPPAQASGVWTTRGASRSGRTVNALMCCVSVIRWTTLRGFWGPPLRDPRAYGTLCSRGVAVQGWVRGVPDRADGLSNGARGRGSRSTWRSEPLDCGLPLRVANGVLCARSSPGPDRPIPERSGSSGGSGGVSGASP